MLLLASYDVFSLRKMRSVSLLTSGLALSVLSFLNASRVLPAPS